MCVKEKNLFASIKEFLRSIAMMHVEINQQSSFDVLQIMCGDKLEKL